MWPDLAWGTPRLLTFGFSWLFFLGASFAAFFGVFFGLEQSHGRVVVTYQQ